MTSTFLLRGGVVTAIAALCAACNGSTPAPQARFVPTFTTVACPASAAEVEVPLTCGTVEVLENRTNQASRRLRLFVVVARSAAADKAPDPVLLLWGGPNPAVDSLFAGLSQPDAAALLGRRDLIVFDYRGMGHSTPNVTCTVDAAGNVDQPACAGALSAAHVDPAGYTDQEMAADVEDIRSALELGALNVWGTSYGSRVALILERRFPAAVRSLILDGMFAPDVRLDATLVRDRVAVIRNVPLACAADAACAAAFPDLEQRFASAISRLNAAPLPVDGKLMSGDELLLEVSGAIAVPAYVAVVPLVMDLAARGTLTTLPWHAEQVASGPSYAPVQQLTYCGANVFEADRAGVEALATAVDGLLAGTARQTLLQRQACAPWPATPATTADKQPVTTAKPTLIFNGEYDSNTPLAAALRAQATLSNSRLVTFPGFGHVAFGAVCPAILALQFVENLNRSPSDESCVQALGEPAWVTQP